MLIVTSLYAGIAALMLIALSFNVIRGRIKHRALFGDAGDAAMTARIRAQANFCEYVPMALLLMALAEAQRNPLWLLHLLGITLIMARCLHAYSLLVRERQDARRFRCRIAGIQMTFAVLLIGALICICSFVSFNMAS